MFICMLELVYPTLILHLHYQSAIRKIPHSAVRGHPRREPGMYQALSKCRSTKRSLADKQPPENQYGQEQKRYTRFELSGRHWRNLFLVVAVWRLETGGLLKTFLFLSSRAEQAVNFSFLFGNLPISYGTRASYFPPVTLLSGSRIVCSYCMYNMYRLRRAWATGRGVFDTEPDW